MAAWMLSELALSRESLLALAYAGFPSILWLAQYELEAPILYTLKPKPGEPENLQTPTKT